MNNEPTNPDAPWEEAMSRDFDARVRDLHEAPLDVSSVKGKARTIKRNRRAAVAGGILGVAAIVTPIAVLTNDDGSTRSRELDVANPSETAEITDPATAVDYVLNGVWHQADGDTVDLPEKDYSGAVIWDDQLVVTRWDGEVFSTADVIDDDGTVVDTFDTTGNVVVNDAGTTIAWIDTDGEVMTAWDDDQVSLGSVDLGAPGETIAYAAAAVTGGPSCNESEGGCSVFVNSGVGTPEVFDSTGALDDPLSSAIEFNDVSSANLVTYTDEIEAGGSCGGLIDVSEPDSDPEWATCDYEANDISPDSRHVIGLPAYYDGLGITQIFVLDAATGDQTGAYAPESGHIGQWAWSTDGNVVFDVYDGAQWHLMTMTPTGEIAEVGEPVKGPDFDSPFALIKH